MSDSYNIMRVGEVRPWYGQIDTTDSTTTLHILALPTYILKDSSGTTVGSGNCTAYDTAAQQAPRCWYQVDATALTPGRYTITFTISAQGSDSLTNKYKPSLEFTVYAVPD